MTLENLLKAARALLIALASLPAFAVEIPDADLEADIGANAVTVDLSTLENRVRETKAISALKKLSLKGEIDDLMDQFREHYRTSKATPVALRQPYERLLDKVAAAVQSKDRDLAKAISASRGSIWASLSDSNKFAGL